MSEFTIRVYAIIEEAGKILFSREKIGNRMYVKFPGGGLEYGEGTVDCLKRELREETGLDSRIKDHFYTTDFFQPSVFHEQKIQVVSIYYRAALIDFDSLSTVDSESETPGFFWVATEDLSVEDVDLPIDKRVIELLQAGR